MVNKAGGDRLSLAICKGLVEAHGGRISTGSSEPGGGARITFTIPIVDATAQSTKTGPTQPTARSSGHLGKEQARVLAVDEDPKTLRYIRSTLWEAGFTPAVSGNPDELERLMDVGKPHLVLLAPTPPWTDGFELMERVGRVSDAPVIILSGNGSDLNMDRAFELGAVDYVAKPFTQTELVARVRAALRRRLAPAQNEASEPFVLGDLAIDYTRRVVTVAGRGVQLTATEYKLLFELSSNAGRVLTHEQLLRLVWGPLYSSDTGVIRAYVKRLRLKLGDDARSPKYIFTEPRVGYRMAKQSTD
jgi:two-component system KDP operon response regulator KdpE